MDKDSHVNEGRYGSFVSLIVHIWSRIVNAYLWMDQDEMNLARDCEGNCMSTFGERLQKLRREKNWSQDTLAQRVGIVRRLISRYETGVSTPSTETLRKLADVFGVSVDFLLADPAESLTDMQVDDNEFLGYMVEIQKMNEFDKKVLKALIQAMIFKSKMAGLNNAQE